MQAELSQEMDIHALPDVLMRIVSELHDVAYLIDTVTAGVATDCLVDVSIALSLVKLADMQKALSGGMRHGHSQPLVKAAGDFDFF